MITLMKQLLLSFLFTIVLVSCKKDKNIPEPSIDAINPTSGSVNTSVIIIGANFNPSVDGNIVKFNGVQANVTSATDKWLAVKVPSGGSTGVITVTNSAGSAIGPTFTYIFPPAISSISPDSGGANSLVTIIGSNFEITPTDNLVTFNGVTAVVQTSTPTTLLVIVPAGASTGVISVTTNTGTATSKIFTVTPTPTITAINPTSGWENTILTITGTRFSTIAEDNRVSINGVQAIVQSSTATSLTVIMPGMGSIGSWPVEVTTAEGKAIGPDFRYCILYVAGYVNNGGINIAKYWKNGIENPLIIGSSMDSFANAIYADNNNVYVAGIQDNMARYWKNNELAVNLSNVYRVGSAEAIIAVGSDVYIAGYEAGDVDFGAKYWKNNAAFPLTDGSRQAKATAIAVKDNDIYIAGYEADAINLQSIAKYWKNGIAIPLSDGSRQAEALAITVVGSAVYVAGYEMNNVNIPIAKYWKNGISIPLTDGTQNANATAITVVDNNVYVAGYEVDKSTSYQVAKYWKNGIAVSLQNGSKLSIAKGIAIAGTDVYVAGYESDGTEIEAKYWKNGVAFPLTNSSWVSAASAIFIR